MTNSVNATGRVGDGDDGSDIPNTDDDTSAETTTIESSEPTLREKLEALWTVVVFRPVTVGVILASKRLQRCSRALG